MVALRFALVCVAATFLQTFAFAQGSRYHSAKCLELDAGCTAFFGTRSVICMAGVAAMDQTTACHNLACQWCTPDRDEEAPCTAPVVREICRLDEEEATPEPDFMLSSPEAEEPKVDPGSCTYMGKDQIVISLGRVQEAEGWTPVERDGLRGMVYRSDLNMGIVDPGMGEMCFPVQVEDAGDYYFTTVSYAPHRTEHNDMWVKVDKNLRLWRNDDSVFFDRSPNTWLKAYQNNGIENGMSVKMWTKDHDPHRFVIRGVPANGNVLICISGRSFRYEVFRMVMRICTGNICTGGQLFGDQVASMPISECV